MRLALGKTKDELVAEAQAIRLEIEEGGITIGDMTIATDDRSKTMVLGALMAARSNPGEWHTVWQTANGGVPVGPQEIEMIASMVQAHINGVFIAYSAVVERILDDTLVSVNQVREYFDSLMDLF